MSKKPITNHQSPSLMPGINSRRRQVSYDAMVVTKCWMPDLSRRVHDYSRQYSMWRASGGVESVQVFSQEMKCDKAVTVVVGITQGFVNQPKPKA
jgi:hypothetical protein